MRTKLVETNKPDRIIFVTWNADTNVIPVGTPLVLDLSPTPFPPTSQQPVGSTPPAGFQDGMAVVLPSTAAASSGATAVNGMNLLTFGVNMTPNFQPNTYGEAAIMGFVNYALVTINTRAASTNVWSTQPSVTGGVPLVLDTNNNAYVTTDYAALVTVPASVTASTSYNVNQGGPLVLLIDNIASQASSATVSTDTRTAIVKGYRVFVRAM